MTLYNTTREDVAFHFFLSTFSLLCYLPTGASFLLPLYLLSYLSLPLLPLLSFLFTSLISYLLTFSLNFLPLSTSFSIPSLCAFPTPPFHSLLSILPTILHTFHLFFTHLPFHSLVHILPTPPFTFPDSNAPVPPNNMSLQGIVLLHVGPITQPALRDSYLRLLITITHLRCSSLHSWRVNVVHCTLLGLIFL